MVESVRALFGSARCEAFELGQIEIRIRIVGPISHGAFKIPFGDGEEIVIHGQNSVVALDRGDHWPEVGAIGIEALALGPQLNLRLQLSAEERVEMRLPLLDARRATHEAEAHARVRGYNLVERSEEAIDFARVVALFDHQIQ